MLDDGVPPVVISSPWRPGHSISRLAVAQRLGHVKTAHVQLGDAEDRDHQEVRKDGVGDPAPGERLVLHLDGACAHLPKSAGG
ncbi:hypothetical protein GT025_17460 [Streptomyces sp. SID4920]|nr:hypothetical protein [Streptomyces sp. SID4920]MYX68983.1 hypothetical protein [Streptomyces sp. SID8373]